MRKSIIIGSVVLGILIVLGFALTIYFSRFIKHIEDTNGDQTELVTINLSDEIQKKREIYVSTVASRRYSGGSSQVIGRLKDKDFDTLNYTVKKFSGVQTLLATQLNENETLQLTIDNKLKGGNLEIVIVDPNNQIIQEVPVNTIETIQIDATRKGTYRVVIGGESANFTIEINRQITK